MVGFKCFDVCSICGSSDSCKCTHDKRIYECLDCGNEYNFKEIADRCCSK